MTSSPALLDGKSDALWVLLTDAIRRSEDFAFIQTDKWKQGNVE
ncbi:MULTISPECIES: hypothetical protein [Leptolyngbya]|nr:hypothetical protein [Leptolyngbya sp. FACHB-1624]